MTRASHGGPLDDLAALVDKQQIVEVITKLFVATDERDWPAVIDCFTPQVLFDTSSQVASRESEELRRARRRQRPSITDEPSPT